MKITIKNTNETTFENVKIGEIFEFENCFYMKIETLQEYKNVKHDSFIKYKNILNINTYILNYIGETVKVNLLNTELIIIK